MARLEDVVAKISNRASSHTSATLNSEFPLASNGLGTFVIHSFMDGLTTKVNFYVRLTNTNWTSFTGIPL